MEDSHTHVLPTFKNEERKIEKVKLSNTSVSLVILYLYHKDHKKEIKSRDRCKGRQSVGSERLLTVISPTRGWRVGRCYRKLGG